MQTVTIGTKNQIVIPKEIRKKIKSFKPGTKVNIHLFSSDSIMIKPVLQNWLDRAEGIAKEAWKGINPIAEVEKMRDEWEERLEEHGKIISESRKNRD